MTSLKLAKRLVGTLPIGRQGLFNPWAEVCPDDVGENGPGLKLAHLASHLNCDARLILCGEAVGYQGCRHSGIAFTSERLILEGRIPRISQPASRLTCRERPFSEPSATIVWGTLERLGLADKTVLWNALQMHPFKGENIRSNRTPSPAEIALGKPAMEILVDAFPRAKVVAVGRKAEALLEEMGIKAAGAVRHPANGGAKAFAAGIEQLARGDAI